MLTSERARHITRRRRSLKGWRGKDARGTGDFDRERLSILQSYSKVLRPLRRAEEALLRGDVFDHRSTRCFCPYHTAAQYGLSVMLVQRAIKQAHARLTADLVKHDAKVKAYIGSRTAERLLAAQRSSV